MKEDNNFPKFPGFPPEPQTNYWPYPRVMNGWWHTLTGSEQKVLDYLLRHTWGYNKTEDFISYSQFLNGIRNRKTGEWVDKGCGIGSRKTLSKAIKGLVARGFIKRLTFKGRTTFYQLKLNERVESKPLVPKVNYPDSEGELLGGSQSKPTIKDITIKDSQQREWIRKYGTGITELISRYGLKQVNDAVRITAAKIRRGEFVQSPIAFITTLCKRGAKWEDTEEAKGEKYLEELGKKTEVILKECEKDKRRT